jgi:hypothetical protein
LFDTFQIAFDLRWYKLICRTPRLLVHWGYEKAKANERV